MVLELQGDATAVVKSFPGAWSLPAAMVVPFLAGLATSLILGHCLVGSLIRHLGSRRRQTAPPEGIAAEDWFAATDPPSTHGLGAWVGWLERVAFFIALWQGVPELVGVWLLFKVGSKWETWINVVKVPETLDPPGHQLDYLRARNIWGSYVLQAFLIGTLGNLLCAIAGIGVASVIAT